MRRVSWIRGSVIKGFRFLRVARTTYKVKEQEPTGYKRDDIYSIPNGDFDPSTGQRLGRKKVDSPHCSSGLSTFFLLFCHFCSSGVTKWPCGPFNNYIIPVRTNDLYSSLDRRSNATASIERLEDVSICPILRIRGDLRLSSYYDCCVLLTTSALDVDHMTCA